MKRFSIRAFVLVWVLLACLAIVRADELATLTGLVTDPSGRSVAGVRVEITNLSTNVSSSTVTNDQGIYYLLQLQPGIYRVTLLKDGFKSIVKSGVELHVQDVASMNFELQVGSVTESVTVTSGAVVMNTTDATVSTVVDQQFVSNIPLNGRSFQNLLTLAPGVAYVGNAGNGGATSNGAGGQITVNGQRTEANYFTVDGVSANTGAAPGNFGYGAGYAGAVSSSTAVGTTQSLVSLDAMQEFRATTSTYSAEYGRTPGGQFAIVTRAGTNDWHGSAYDYFRNDAMDANNWFNNFYGLPKTAERQNDFGGTLSGPIVIPSLYNGKDKTFFFFSYEGLRLLVPQPATQVSVPDMSLRKNAPSSIQPILNAFPVPNAGEDGLNDGLAFYNEAVSFPSSLDSISVRIDHSFSDKFKVFGRYGDTPSDASVYNSALKNNTTIKVWTMTLGVTNLVTPTQSNDFRFNITGSGSDYEQVSTNLGGATPFNLNSIPGPKGPGFPEKGSFLLFYLAFGGFPGLILEQQATTQKQYNLTDAYTLALGRHSLKFGGDWRRLATKAIPYFEQLVEYFDEASVLSNTAGYANANVQAPSPVEPVYTNFSAFVQDEWKATPRLSLSMGVRWDVNPAPGNALGPRPYTVTQITNLATTQLAPEGTPLWKTTWTNFAPRLGLAYQLRPRQGRETVLRAGFGTFYDLGSAQGSDGFNGPGFSSTVSYSGASFPLSTAQLQVPPPSVAPPYNQQVYAFDPNLKLPYTLQWNVAVQQALSSKQSVTVNYVGSSGRKLLTNFYYLPQYLGNPNFPNGFTLYTNQGTSSYNALQVQYQRQFSRGLQALASYTWSHSIDNASSNFSTDQLLRASSDFDIRQNFQAALTYDVPGNYSSPVLSAILKHWGLDTRISATSALPVNIIGTQSLDPGTGQYYLFSPDLVPGQPLYLLGPQYPGGRVINFNAFVAAPANVQGNTPRNYARGFSAVQADLALRRDFPIHERFKLQFRVEAFNLLNHPNFGAIYNQLSDGAQQFGYAYSTLNNSLGGLSSLYQVGGPRSLQVMLKLAF